ncbi:MAG: D-alanyl-D-alanine carboxypeptidase/D-alanyl-D-alanine-endopeptidase [Bacteroidales bacterium]|nr:D-alanyl-D-alanine carboxypeptidase/D-alanyl-D-alanine-endopeptidase [Bacteroidales bacterium]
MKKVRLLVFLFATAVWPRGWSQDEALEVFLSDPALVQASVSICIKDAVSGMRVLDYGSRKSMNPASVLKLFTSAAALELLGPDHTFTTGLGYSGKFNRNSGTLKGNIVIRGGGDPALGSGRFADHYGDFMSRWADALSDIGIKQIKGRVITDDTYFDYLPVPAKWLWEDIGNYYGAGAFGLSVFENTYEIRLRTSSGSATPLITGIFPEECRHLSDNRLVAEGNTDKGYVFAAPYSVNGWMAGRVPENRDDFVLKASIPDPPRLVAEITDKKLREKGIRIEGTPISTRQMVVFNEREITPVDSVVSPALSEIARFLNHESINMYAEHLLKELGKVFLDTGTTTAGIEVVMQFLSASGVNTDGMFIEDGSGLSPLNAIRCEEMVNLLIHMRTEGKYFSEFYSSLPVAGQEGTVAKYFRDPVFDSNLRAKSGSMTRVRSYAGYFTALSGKEMTFCIMVNNFTGSSQRVVTLIEALLKQIILNN